MASKPTDGKSCGAVLKDIPVSFTAEELMKAVKMLDDAELPKDWMRR